MVLLINLKIQQKFIINRVDIEKREREREKKNKRRANDEFIDAVN